MKRKAIYTTLERIAYYCGATYVKRKFLPTERKSVPTGVLWILGLYVGFFGLVYQRYETRVRDIESQANTILVLVATDARRAAISQIPIVQKLPCPVKPDILNPVATVRSFLGQPQFHHETAEALKRIVETLKEDLEDVHLEEANLEGISLPYANLKKAHLWHANLRSASLVDADLSNARLGGADMQGACLAGALLKGAGLETIGRQTLSPTPTNLENANLCSANLEGADLYGANLKGAMFEKANLTNVLNLTIWQIAEAATLYEANLDPEIMQQVMTYHPYLLDRPVR